MNELHLSKRLEVVASYVPPGLTLADIGSDHAYLPTYLCLKEITPYAIAGEVNEGPYQSALNQVEKSNLTEKVSVRKGNGLEVLAAQEVDVITICGMGGALIAEILEAGKDKLKEVKRLILQPNVMSERVRQWLLEHCWELVSERIIEEDEKIYEILVAEQGDAFFPYTKANIQVEILAGPFLIKEKNDAFQKKWKAEVTNWRRILEQFEQAKSSKEIEEKKSILMEQIRWIEEVLYDDKGSKGTTNYSSV